MISSYYQAEAEQNLPWLPEVIQFSGEQESKKCDEQKKITSGQTNQQPHFYTMYEIRYSPKRFLKIT